MKTSVLSLALCALLLAVMPACTQNEECIPTYLTAAYLTKNWKAVYRSCLPLAEQGDAGAQFILGEMYYNGEGVARDYVRAMSWFRQAAEQGLMQAQGMLGLMYEDGLGINENHIAAYKWYSLAAVQGDEKVSEWIDQLEKQMSPEEIAEAQKQTAEWLAAHPKAAE